MSVISDASLFAFFKALESAGLATNQNGTYVFTSPSSYVSGYASTLCDLIARAVGINSGLNGTGATSVSLPKEYRLECLSPSEVANFLDSFTSYVNANGGYSEVITSNPNYTLAFVSELSDALRTIVISNCGQAQ